MHPVFVLLPVAALIVGPRWWVWRVLKRHNQREYESFRTGAEMASELLKRCQLHEVKVEWTDVSDHYDPATKTVRLTRDKYERRTLAAITTAAHEVAHALQHASNYRPFLWRARLVQVAQATGFAGSVILITVPATAVLTGYRLPPALVGAAALSMLGTGLAAQMAALPTELDASFSRAMPWLVGERLSAQQVRAAREILVASSFTYIASSLLAVLNVWPWLGGFGPVRLAATQAIETAKQREGLKVSDFVRGQPHQHGKGIQRRSQLNNHADVLPTVIRSLSKPIVRVWFRLRMSL
jgi:Zn-dependent membrane protease YugP